MQPYLGAAVTGSLSYSCHCDDCSSRAGPTPIHRRGQKHAVIKYFPKITRFSHRRCLSLQPYRRHLSARLCSRQQRRAVGGRGSLWSRLEGTCGLVSSVLAIAPARSLGECTGEPTSMPQSGSCYTARRLTFRGLFLPQLKTKEHIQDPLCSPRSQGSPPAAKCPFPLLQPPMCVTTLLGEAMLGQCSQRKAQETLVCSSLIS